MHGTAMDEQVVLERPFH